MGTSGAGKKRPFWMQWQDSMGRSETDSVRSPIADGGPSGRTGCLDRTVMPDAGASTQMGCFGIMAEAASSMVMAGSI
jgi:hypothetical protein